MKIQTLTAGLILSVMLTSACGAKSEEKMESRSSELIKQGDDLFNDERKSEALEAYKMAADTALAENSNSTLTEAYAQVARCYLSMDNKEEGCPWLEKAEKIASKEEPEGWARYLGVKGRYLWKDASAEKHEIAPEAGDAAKTFTDMYNYSLEHRLYNQAIDAANMMSIVGSKDERVEWSLKGIKAAEDGGLVSWLASLWNNLGWNYDDLGQFDKSLEALKEARRYHYKKGDEKSMLIADWSVAHAFRMTGRIDSALVWCQRTVIWAKDLYDADPSPDNAEWMGLTYQELAEASLASGDEKRALAGFRSARMYLNQANMKEWDEKGYNELLDKIAKLEANAGKGK
jgi:tetratricopeptide (TPR) repeat protein